MAIIGALDKTKHLAEFNEPLDTAEGVLTPEQRKARAMSNLGADVAENITVAEDQTSTLPGGNLQEVLEALAARIDAVEGE